MRELSKNPFLSSDQLSEMIDTDLNKSITGSAIRKILIKNGFKSYISKRNPLLTKAMSKKRLSWCHKYKNKDNKFWQNVAFSDETMISILDTSLMQRCRRFPWSSPYENKFIRPTVKYPLSVMIWGCFSKNYRPSLHVVNGIMNSAKYEEVLNSKIKGKFNQDKTLIFQDDSASCHRSARINQYKNNNGILSLDWPENSQNLNPIENLWQILKRKVGRFNIKNKADLIKKINKIWEEHISDDLITNLIDSMPKRIDKCIKNKGYATKY